ncbi:hypothetical protein JCGZ_04362 [Jatropha curcas]|uniref:Cytochrome P450 n=1 Tax=Jatropha curcas TaxID=180498 RepID=A0A067KQM1_JATCU|nr:hypothetical protein JCGZ_04362 [Jatropha curcas]
MGVHRNLVVSNWEIAKECLTTNDKAFATSPKILTTEHLANDLSMFGFSPYGTYWREMRKIATLELLSNHRLELLRHVQQIAYMTVNQEEERWKGAMRDFFDLSGMFIAADAVPFLRWFHIGGHEKAMNKTAKELDNVFEEWLNEHKEKKASGFKYEEEDFMDLMLNIIDDDVQVALGRDSDTINKAACMALTLAASDSTAVTLTWALSLLINNPDVLKKAQQELDIYVGKERLGDESDINTLVYLNAIIKEIAAFIPSWTPCCATRVHGGLHRRRLPYPSGTRLITIWKIQRDPPVWSNLSDFNRKDF